MFVYQPKDLERLRKVTYETFCIYGHQRQEGICTVFNKTLYVKRQKM